MAYIPGTAVPPEGYQTPDQIKSLLEQAQGNIKGAQRDKEITSPWQGARMMMDAVTGNILRNRAGQQQIGSSQYDASTMPRDPWITTPPPAVPYSTPGMPGTGSSLPKPTIPSAAQPPQFPSVPYYQPGMPGTGSTMMSALMTPPPGYNTI